MRPSLVQWALIALFGFSLAAMPVELSFVDAIQALAFDLPEPIPVRQRGPYPPVPLDLEQLGLPGVVTQ